METKTKLIKGSFATVAVAATGLSMWSGFDTYTNFLGYNWGILAVGIFEAARLAVLYSVVVIRWRLIIPAYILIAAICGGAGIVAFSNKINEKNVRHESQLNDLIFQARAELRKQLEQKAEQKAKQVQEAQKQLAQAKAGQERNKVRGNEKSSTWYAGQVTYYQEILSQIQAQKIDIQILTEVISDKEKWLHRVSGLYGIKVNYTDDNSVSIGAVVYELLGIRGTRAAKYLAIIIVMMIEFLIILFSLLARWYQGKPKDKDVVIGDICTHQKKMYENIVIGSEWIGQENVKPKEKKKGKKEGVIKMINGLWHCPDENCDYKSDNKKRVQGHMLAHRKEKILPEVSDEKNVLQ